jgi:phosphohistidine phosphatase
MTQATEPPKLVLMRHGEAEDGNQDYIRKLTWKGEEQAYYMAEQYKQRNLHFDLILASGAYRTTQTATIIREYFDNVPQLLLSPHLYNFNWKTLQDVLALIHPNIQSILVVGHNPGISKVSNQLSNVQLYFSTAQCVVLDINNKTTDLSFSQLLCSENWNFLYTITPEINSI